MRFKNLDFVASHLNLSFFFPFPFFSLFSSRPPAFFLPPFSL